MNDYSNHVVGFTKLFAGLVHSTVWREEMHIKVVWITMLALADRNGEVLASMPGLADASRVTLEQCTEALERLKGPDKHSRTKANGGRRIKEIEGGWKLLNYLKYRQMRDDIARREQVRDAVRRHRAKSAPVIDVSHVSRSKPIAEAEVEAEGTEERKDVLTNVPHDVRAERSIQGERVRLERRLLALTSEIADLEEREATGIMVQLTSYRRSDGGKVNGRVNPALLSFERLQKSVEDGEAWLLEVKNEKARPGPGAV